MRTQSSSSARVWIWLLVAAIVGSGVSPLLMAQDEAKPMANRPRLPRYYAKVVTPQQRKEIYGIQAQYQAEIDALQKQLDALTQKRDAEIRGTLDAEQQKHLDELVATAEAKQAKKRAKKADTEKADTEKASAGNASSKKPTSSGGQ
jgi:endonuclease/exonuclease/phosphatase (EEP) superfamily protein YafD